jgi:hypothetical protein
VDAIDRAPHLMPAGQPSGVQHISARLFAAYTIEGGSVQLAGCLLEDRLFARVEFTLGEQQKTVLIDSEGREVGEPLARELGLDNLIAVSQPPAPCAAKLLRLVEAAKALVGGLEGKDAVPEPISVAALWCRHAEGTLRFSIGERSVELRFAGWARVLKPPPYSCPLTGIDTFHLAATDDGRIAAAEGIEQCQQTGRRMLSRELVTCAITGRRVLAELTVQCPVTGDRLLADQSSECQTCRQPVSPAALWRGQCAACRGLQAVDKADPRVARLLHDHPALDRWKRWCLAETATVYIFMATRWFRKLLLVVDRQSWEPKVVAEGNRLYGGWEVVEPVRHEQLLHG